MATAAQRDHADADGQPGDLDPATARRELEHYRAELAAYQAANKTLNEWINGAHALALLRGALTSGVFDAARTPRTPAEMAEITGLDEGQVADIAAALVAHGVFERAGDRFRLTPDFARLAGPNAFFGLPQLVEVRLVEARTLEAIGSPGGPYTALPTEDLLAIARGVTFADPAAPIMQARRALLVENLPEVCERGAAGGRHAEFGCGIGSRVLLWLLMWPRVTAVGYEINAQVVAEARRRAAALGVADRVEFRHADVRDIRDEAVFDDGFWSQSFFPAESRAAALAAIRRALKPGGYLVVPGFEGGEPPASEAGWREPQGQAYLRSRLVYRRWGIPTPTAVELRAELEGAGFEFVRSFLSGLWQILLVRRPLA